MNATNQIILATANNTTWEEENAEDAEGELQTHHKYWHLKKDFAGVDVLVLNLFNFIAELVFFDHEASLFFAAMLLHFISDFFEMLVAENVIVFEETSNLLSSLILFSSDIFALTSSAAITVSSGSTFKKLWFVQWWLISLGSQCCVLNLLFDSSVSKINFVQVDILVVLEELRVNISL